MKKVLLALAILVLVIGIVGFFLTKTKKQPLVIEQTEEKLANADYLPYVAPENASPITGLACENHTKRSFGIMYSGSLDAREYWKNLSEADFILEMPHRMHNEPRFLAIFQCNLPDSAGPMRSGRVDHMAVADALGAVFVTWGKSIVTASAMNRGLAENLEVGNGTASKDGTRAGFIDPGIRFASANSAYADLSGVIKMSQDKGYQIENKFTGFLHQGELALEKRPDYAKIDVEYDDGPFIDTYLYDKQTNSYLRYKKEKPSVDYATKKQYAPKNIITIITKRDSWLAEKDYVAEGLLDPWVGVPEEKVESNQYPNMQLGDPWFDTKFEGEAKFFMNGQYIKGTWKREKGKGNPFKFFDENGAEIAFVPGQIWMHVLPHEQKVSYEDEQERQARLEEEAKIGQQTETAQ